MLDSNFKQYLLSAHNIVILQQIGYGLTSTVYRVANNNNLSTIKCIKIYNMNININNNINNNMNVKNNKTNSNT